VAKKVGAEKKRESGNLKEALGAVLTELRTKKGWSIRELSHRTSYVPNTIQNVEMGRKSPTLDTLEVFARAYSMKASALLRAAERRVKVVRHPEQRG
jgi:transcriptional regulator with XRE-family HTH domain